MGILEGQLQRLQNAFSQYKKGEFLDLTLSQAPSMGLRLSLGLACSLLGLGLNWTCWDHDWDWTKTWGRSGAKERAGTEPCSRNCK